MNRSRSVHRAIVQRIADEGQLAEGWSVGDAADLFYTVTMQGPWRELTRELGWTSRRYAKNMTRLLLSSLVRHPHEQPVRGGPKRGRRRSRSDGGSDDDQGRP